MTKKTKEQLAKAAKKTIHDLSSSSDDGSSSSRENDGRPTQRRKLDDPVTAAAG
jgi:hypothetical protein